MTYLILVLQVVEIILLVKILKLRRKDLEDLL